MLWGITLRPGEELTRVVHHPEYLSLASLECRPSKNNGELNPSSYLLVHIDGEEQMLCMLQKGSIPQQRLDLKVTETLKFSVEGTGTVYLTGYSLEESIQVHQDTPSQLVGVSATPANDTQVRNQRARGESVTPEKLDTGYPCTKNGGMEKWENNASWDRDLAETDSVDREDPGDESDWSDDDTLELEQPSSPFSDEVNNFDDMSRDTQGYSSDNDDIHDENLGESFKKSGVPMDDGDEEEDMWVLASSDDEKCQSEMEKFDETSTSISPAAHWQKGSDVWYDDSILKEDRLKENKRVDGGPLSGDPNEDQRSTVKREETKRNLDQGVAASDRLRSAPDKCLVVKSEPVEVNSESSIICPSVKPDSANRKINFSQSDPVQDPPKFANFHSKDKGSKTSVKDTPLTPKEPAGTANHQLNPDSVTTGQSWNSQKSLVTPNAKADAKQGNNSTPNRGNVHAGKRLLFPCQYCSMRFAFHHSLREHELTHSTQAEKQVVKQLSYNSKKSVRMRCGFCRKYLAKNLFVEHVQSHTRESQVKSRYRPELLPRKRNTRNHKGKNHGRCQKKLPNKAAAAAAAASATRHIASSLKRSSSATPASNAVTAGKARKPTGSTPGAKGSQAGATKFVGSKQKIRKFGPCSYCGKLFLQRAHLVEHVRVHTGEKPFQCALCKRLFRTLSYVRDHLRKVHGFSTLLGMKNAVRKLSSTDPTSLSIKKTCKVKVSRTAVPHSLSQTARGRIRYSEGGSSPVDTTTDGLNRSLVNGDGSTGERTPATTANSVAGNDPETTQEQSVPLQTQFTCGFCSRTFESKQRLWNHTQTHSDDGLWSCSVCKGQYVSKKTLDSHMRTHIDERPFRCRFCPKRFFQKSHMTRHELLHKEKTKS